MGMKYHFHINSFVLSLALKQIHKWPIKRYILLVSTEANKN